jgi:hypothetical protein
MWISEQRATARRDSEPNGFTHTSPGQDQIHRSPPWVTRQKTHRRLNNAGGSDLVFHRNTITADNSEFDGVQKIRFDFGNTEASGTGYSEIDVFAVPEPSTTALLGLGGLALILRRRK